MEKRTIAAIALTVLFFAFYPMVLRHFYPNYGKPTVTRPVSSGAPASSSAGGSAAPSLVTDAGAALQPADPSNDLAFGNKSLKTVFNQSGAAIRSVEFPLFPHEENGKPLKWISQDTIGTNLALLRLNDAVGTYKLSRAGNEISGTAEIDGVRVQKRYVFDEKSYASKLYVILENPSSEPKTVRFELFAGSGLFPRNSIDRQYIEGDFFSSVDGKASLKHIPAPKSGKTIESAGPVSWVALKDRHFSAILRPLTDQRYTGVVRGLDKKGDEADFSVSLLSSAVLAPGAREERVFQVYIGPVELQHLQPIGLGDIVNFGKLDWIGKLLVGALEMLHGVFRNYGLAVIALTILINIFLFPLTRASFMSMKRMQLIQPQMTKLREQHKKNPERLNKEMMELYKKHKVNPFGGCLPMLLQMPVFMALYVALSKSVILINSKFLWVTDLSSPDKVYLPFTLPVLGNGIHLLPLIMMVAMVVQQKFTSMKMEGQDPAMAQQQKMMAVMMPIIFGFIFYAMPSGLVLYWLTNTLLMTAYQFHLKKMTLA